ncbi:MAG: hypothetical protein HZA00_14945 [Nitrospinae bacterium]|nr:hypothetical protein [Nitrospinota bacterium]
MKPSKISAAFIVLVAVHLNLIMPVNKPSNGGDICIMDNGIHIIKHSSNYKVYDHRKETYNKMHENEIQKIRNTCNDMPASDILFPGSKYPFINDSTVSLSYDKLNQEAILFKLVQFTDGFTIPIYNPPEPAS